MTVTRCLQGHVHETAGAAIDCNHVAATGPKREPATELRLVITFTEPVYTEPLTDGLGEWMRELEAEADGFAKLGIADWRFEAVTT